MKAKANQLVMFEVVEEAKPEEPKKQVETRPPRLKNKSASSLKSLLTKYQKPVVNKYVSREFQDYGYRLACEMGEEDKKSMYIKMAKTVDRAILERARSYVVDAENARSKGRLFVWAVGKFKKGEELGGVEG